jgi:methylated-DNA-[protein]-cysteine S-methyltransferase
MNRSRISPAPDLHEARLLAPFAVVGVRTEGERLAAIDYLALDTPLVLPREPLLDEACRQIEAYLRNPRHRFDLPLKLDGTPYRQRVWQAIAAIPAGRTRSYADIAAEMGSSPRAVGQACGANPLPIVVPCHRVVAKGGGLGGFMHSEGDFPLSVKRWLLAHERS